MRSWSIYRLAALLTLALVCIVLASSCNPRETVVKASREDQLRSTLSAVRDAISVYAKKHGGYPSSLEELVRTGLLKSLPVDPVSRSSKSWRLIRESRVTTDDFLPTDTATAVRSAPIVDIRSGAPGVDPSGVPWSEY